MQKGQVLIFLLVGTLIAIALAGIFYLRKQTVPKPDGLDEIRQEQAVQLVYPQAAKLRHSESPKRSNLLEGTTTPPFILDTYGVNALDQEVGAFYQQRLEELGWKLAGTPTGMLHKYRRLLFDKAGMRAEVGFWYREDFQDQYPSIDIEGFTMLYELYIFKLAD